jgi:hypothetical protein
MSEVTVALVAVLVAVLNADTPAGVFASVVVSHCSIGECRACQHNNSRKACENGLESGRFHV